MAEYDSWIVPSSAYLLMQVSIQTAGSAAFADPTSTANIAPVNNLGQSMFQKVEYQINDSSIEEIRQNHIVGQVKGLLEPSPAHGSSAMSDMLWYPDDGAGGTSILKYDGVDYTSVATIGTTLEASGANYNAGRHSRVKKFTGASPTIKKVMLKVPLSKLFGFCNDSTHAYIGARHRISLQRHSSDGFLLHRVGLADGKVVIHNMVLQMPIIKPSISKTAELLQFLNTEKKYDTKFRHTNCYTTSGRPQIASQVTRWHVSTVQERILQVFVLFQEDTALSNQTTNGLIFNHMSCEEISLRVGSKYMPEQPHRPVFTDNEEDYVRLFHDLLSLSKVMSPESSSHITYDNFKSLYPIFAFDLSAVDESVFVGNPVDLQVEAKITSAGTYTIHCVVVSERECTLSVVNKKVLLSKK